MCIIIIISNNTSSHIHNIRMRSLIQIFVPIILNALQAYVAQEPNQQNLGSIKDTILGVIQVHRLAE